MPTAISDSHSSPNQAQPFGWRPRPIRAATKKYFGIGPASALGRLEKNALKEIADRIRGRAITRTESDVFRALIDRAHGACFPRYETIAKDAACSRRSVARAVDRLRELGLIDWTHRIKRVVKSGRSTPQRASNCYIFPTIALDDVGRIVAAILNIIAAMRRTSAASKARAMFAKLTTRRAPETNEIAADPDAALTERLRGPPLPYSPEGMSRLMAGLDRLASGKGRL